MQRSVLSCVTVGPLRQEWQAEGACGHGEDVSRCCPRPTFAEAGLPAYNVT